MEPEEIHLGEVSARCCNYGNIVIFVVGEQRRAERPFKRTVPLERHPIPLMDVTSRSPRENHGDVLRLVVKINELVLSASVLPMVEPLSVKVVLGHS